MDRHLSPGERVDLVLEDVAGDDRVAQLGEAGGGDEADPADPDDSDRLFLRAHLFPPRFGFFFGTITAAERAIPTIWSLLRLRKRSFDIQ